MKTRKISKKNWILFIILIALSIVLIAVDQITKSVVFDANEQGKLPISIIKGVLSISYAENFGGAFGSMAGNHVLFFILTVLALPLFCFFVYYRRNNGNTGCFGIALMFAGTVGNAIDRAFRGDGFFNGGVRDFFATECFGPLDSIFNIADIALVVGVALFAASLLFFDKDSLIATIKKDKAKKIENDRENSGEEISGT